MHSSSNKIKDEYGIETEGLVCINKNGIKVYDGEL